MLERWFRLQERGTDGLTELRAGTVTFLTMAYILLVNPQILSQAGMPAEAVVLATALSAALATLVMGLYANFPFALAPGMGLNAYFAFSVVGGMGVSWQVALAAVFVEGILFLLLSFLGVRSRLLEGIPEGLKRATMAGIGLFLAFIGLRGCGLVVDHPATLVTLGDLSQPSTLLAALGVLAMGALLARRVPGGILIAIVGVTGASWALGLASPPERWAAWPKLPPETFLALDFEVLFSGTMISVVLAFFFVDLLDTAGTLVGVGQLGGFIDRDGRFPGSERAFVADAVGTIGGALLGTSTVTTYIESATGVEEGGRTGLSAVVTAAYFLLALAFAPLLVAVPVVATSPALVVVGALMMRGAAGIEWSRLEEGLPAFLTVSMMAFTYSIAHGIALGVLSWVGLRLLTGRIREVGWVPGGLAVALLAYYAFLGAH